MCVIDSLKPSRCLSMTACVVPFPSARRSRFVRKQAAYMAALPQAAAEKHLQQQLELQARTMSRKSMDPEIINEDLRQLELAIRAALWSLVLSPEGAA